MRLRSILVVAVPLLIGAVVATWWLASGESRAAAVVSIPTADDVAPARTPTPFAGPGQSSSPSRASAVAAVSTPPASGLAAQVDQWAASTDPADAMKAYRAVLDCLLARRDERRPAEEVATERENMEAAVLPDQRARLRRRWGPSAVQCGDLRSDQVQSRTQWLARAAQAGVPLAAMEFIYEGPNGDGFLQDLGVPRPPLSDAWRAQRDAYVQAALDHCDMALVGMLGMHSRDAKGLAEQLNFWQAHARCPGVASPGALADDPQAGRYLRDLGDIGAQQAAPPLQ